MRIALAIICSFFLNAVVAQSLLAKTKWAERERKLWAELDSGKIDSEEWYKRKRVEAGSLGTSLQAWFISKSVIDGVCQTAKERNDNKTFAVRIPDKFQITKENGNRYIQLMLVNNSDSIVTIPRSDATVLGFSCYVKLRNEWILLRGTPIVPCGNSFFTELLARKSLITVELEDVDHGDGDIEIPFKINFQFNDQTIESNEIKIKLHANQIERLLDENEMLKQNREKKTTHKLYKTSVLQHGG